MKNKGFTLVELITTLALVATIIIILMNVVLTIKDLYFKYDTKTILYINQANLSKELNSKIKNNPYKYLSTTNPYTCNSSGCTFNRIDGTSPELSVTPQRISFDGYVYRFEDGTSGSFNYNVVQVGGVDTFLNIRIDINNVLYPGQNFGVNIVYFLR